MLYFFHLQYVAELSCSRLTDHALKNIPAFTGNLIPAVKWRAAMEYSQLKVAIHFYYTTTQGTLQ